MPVELELLRSILLETRYQKAKPIIPLILQLKWVRFPLTILGSTTCLEIYGSGVKTIGMRITLKPQQTKEPG
jgi:hypothetical protein